MREIKFRAWLPSIKKMTYTHSINELMGWHRINGYTPNIKWLQYVGLKDKNGVEIYEGDVLNRPSYWGWYVAYEDGGYRRVPTNKVQRINWEHYNLTQDDLEHWEVIGNIYENPELLRGDK